GPRSPVRARRLRGRPAVPRDRGAWPAGARRGRRHRGADGDRRSLPRCERRAALRRGAAIEARRPAPARPRRAARVGPVADPLGGAERAWLARERVGRPVELRGTPVLVSDDLEQLASLAARDGAETVAFDVLEDGGAPPLGRGGETRLEAPGAPTEDELVALRPPAPEDARERRRGRLARPPELRLLGLERGRRELPREAGRIERSRRVREHGRPDPGLGLHDDARDAADRASVV